MAGGVMLVFVDKFKKYEKSISLVIIAGLVAVNIGYFKPRGYLEDNNLLYYTDSELIQSKMSGVIPDYIHPKVGLAKKTVSPPENRFVLYKDNSETPLEAIIDRGHEFALVVPPGPKGTLRVNIFDYPGWKFFENGNEIDFKFAEDLPVFEIPIEPNKTGKEILISGKLMETPLRQRADAVSVISILILAFILMDKDIILNNKKE
jgi:hypothetical protein